MIASQDEEILGILDLICQEKADGFQGLFPSIYVVSQKEVVGLGGKSSVFEQTEQIVVLAMNIAANLNRRIRHQHVVEASEDSH